MLTFMLIKQFLNIKRKMYSNIDGEYLYLIFTNDFNDKSKLNSSLHF